MQLAKLIENKEAQLYIILLFVSKSVAIEYLSTHPQDVTSSNISLDIIWNKIHKTLQNKLLLSCEIKKYFSNSREAINHDFLQFIDIAKNFYIDDLEYEKLICSSDQSCISLLINGKYLENPLSIFKKSESSVYDAYDCKLCSNAVIYDPFKFGSPSPSTMNRYFNEVISSQSIDSIFTVVNQLPELIVLYENNTHEKIYNENIVTFLVEKERSGEISKDIFNKIKNEYPDLFLNPPTVNEIMRVYNKINTIISKGVADSKKNKLPLLIIAAEIHDAKISYLLSTLVAIAAKQQGINYLLSETINLHHKKNGWPILGYLNTLFEFSQKVLSMQVIDLDEKLEYKGVKIAYPYHEIPVNDFGIDIREKSWITDISALKKSSILILGAGHLNNILNSVLKNEFEIVPINVTSDAEYSKKLSIDKSNLIELHCNLSQMTLSEITELSYSNCKV
jgi:hypothetical protein